MSDDTPEDAIPEEQASTTPTTLNPPRFMWGGNPLAIPPIPAMYVGMDADGNITIPVGPAGVDVAPPPPSSTVVTLNPPTFLWGEGRPTLTSPLPIMLVGLKNNLPYLINVNMGVTDGSEAKAGEIGEYKVAADTTGINLVSAVPQAVAQINLTPGCWEVWGLVDFLPDANKSPNMICASVSTHSNALPTDADLYTGVGIMTMFTTAALTSGQRQVLMTGQCRANTATPLMVYLVAQSAWGGGGTVFAKGYISARRVR